MIVKDLLREYKNRVDPILETYFQSKRDRYQKFPDFIEQFSDHLAEFTLRGGKRLRSALIYYTYLLFSDSDLDEVVRTSTFIELVQSFLLIHDDIMDRADLRRGKATLHKIYEEVSRQQRLKDDFHFGNTMAILAGDLGSQLAYEIIHDSNFSPEKKNKVAKLTAAEISEVIFGQIGDILLRYEFSEEDVSNVHKHKTATYTFRLPMLAGGILAGADNNQLRILEDYAIPCGIAFQIRDDVLGVFGNDESTGKSSLSDLREGKKTLLVSESYKNASHEQKQKLHRALGKLDLGEEEAQEVRDIFKSTGALNYSIVKCEEHIANAKQALKPLSGKNPDAYQFLNDLADYIIIRDI